MNVYRVLLRYPTMTGNGREITKDIYAEDDRDAKIKAGYFEDFDEFELVKIFKIGKEIE
jgi:hypothetical protein